MMVGSAKITFNHELDVCDWKKMLKIMWNMKEIILRLHTIIFQNIRTKSEIYQMIAL